MSKIVLTTILGMLTMAGIIGPVAAQHNITCRPASDRTGEVGCWIMGREALRPALRSPLYWHIDTFTSWAEAEAAKGLSGTIIESMGKVWLFTIAEVGWLPSGGQRAAQIGPLPVSEASEHAAVYMETVLPPGFSAPVHRHPGPEAVYVVAGEVCMETPNGKTIERRGTNSHVIPADRPMALTVTGSEHLRSIVLILHDASQAAVIPAPKWTPRGLCRK
ncbi:cupin domain-containing protein [Mesorhizobium sp.]|uniref:cupin domain-containing protein n=1 Tax=Mesorhizobium sp. TaxID=1871066 RepID=UPI001214E8A9|nr:cupin domain-containing protein [Mesorhizobium sp.]TIT01653.1 MAG: cupin domain-containing protein [Mesorhizobium sp.]